MCKRRLVVGWTRAQRLAGQFVVETLKIAHAQRGPRDMVHHADHGSEYTAGKSTHVVHPPGDRGRQIPQSAIMCGCGATANPL